MTDQRHRSAQQFSTPHRTEVLPQQGWQPVAPPQGSWQPAQHWPHQPQHPQPQAGWPQQAQQQWQPQHFARPQHDPSQPSSEEKNGALGAFLGAFFMPVVLPLLIMLTGTNKPFQRAAALQALIVQLSSLLLAMLSPLLMTVFLVGGRNGLTLFWLASLPFIVLGLYSLAFALMGMADAQQGKVRYAPLIGRRLAKTFRAEWPSA